MILFLDEYGRADVDGLIEGIGRTRKFNMDLLEETVRTDEKQGKALRRRIRDFLDEANSSERMGASWLRWYLQMVGTALLCL